MQMHNDFLRMVSYHHKEASLLLLETIADESADARVTSYS